MYPYRKQEDCQTMRGEKKHITNKRNHIIVII